MVGSVPPSLAEAPHSVELVDACAKSCLEFVFSQDVGTLITANSHESGTEITLNRISEDEWRLVFQPLPPVTCSTQEQF